MSIEDLKAKGNEAFSQKDFTTALDFFTRAIELDKTNHVLYSNRSACFASLKRYEEALSDANKTIELKKDWSKGYSRKGAALAYLTKYKDAAEAYQQGLAYEPNNELLKKGLEEVQSQLESENPFNQFGKMFNDPSIWMTIATSPSLEKYRNNPTFIEKVKKIQSDPKLIGEYLSDPGVMALLSAIMGINLPNEEKNKENNNETNYSTKKNETKSTEFIEETEESLQANAALKEKELGNIAYKKKDFETAIQHYEKAIELNKTECVFYLNLAAVYIEKNEYEKCRELCQQAIQIGQDNHCDFKMMAKIYHRMGVSYLKENNLEDAIQKFKVSLTEHRTKETLNLLQETERKLKEIKIKEYINPELSLQEKEKGNNFFKLKQHPEAIGCYTEAIKRNPDDHTVYSNRAASYMALGEYPTAIKDCDKSIELCPTFIKSFLRKAQCYHMMKQYLLSLETYEKALKLDDKNYDAQYGCQRALMMIQQQKEEMSNKN